MNFQKLVTPVRYSLGLSARAWRSYFEGRSTVVLGYHRVDPPRGSQRNEQLFGVENGVPVDVFESQIRFMLKHFEPRSTTSLYDESCRRPGFAVTFDDGYEDNLLLAAPVLKRLGVPATVFLSTGMIDTDQRFWWEILGAMLRETQRPKLEVKQIRSPIFESDMLPSELSIEGHPERSRAHWLISELLMETPDEEVMPALERLAEVLGVSLRQRGRDYGLLTWKQVRELQEYGFEIGAHGHCHLNLGQASRESVHAEVVESVKAIRGEIGGEVRTFAYPYGRSVHRSLVAAEEIQKLGFDAVFTTDLGVFVAGSDRFAIPRAGLTQAGALVCAYHVERAYQSEVCNRR